METPWPFSSPGLQAAAGCPQQSALPAHSGAAGPAGAAGTAGSAGAAGALLLALPEASDTGVVSVPAPGPLQMAAGPGTAQGPRETHGQPWPGHGPAA